MGTTSVDTETVTSGGSRWATSRAVASNPRPAVAIGTDTERQGRVIRTANREWDAFISHAGEDKDDVVRPLAEGLQESGLSVWFDEFELKVGDSLRESIDRGLSRSRFGIVVFSPHFFNKQWPQNELNGLVTRETGDAKVILPVWHNIDAEAVRTVSPVLADRVATSSSKGLKRVIEDLMQAVAPPAVVVGSPTPAGARPTTLPRPAASPTIGADDLDGDMPQKSVEQANKAAQEIADRIRQEVESLAKPGEKWTVSDGPRISVTMYNPKDPTSGRGRVIDASNYDDLESVMDSLRSHWADRAREDEEYAKALLEKFESEA